MSDELASMATQQVVNYKNATKYLDRCGEFTFAKLCEVYRIAGIDTPQSQLRYMWEQSQIVVASHEGPGGSEYLRRETRLALLEGTAAIEAAADTLDGATEKKWWQFWK